MTYALIIWTVVGLSGKEPGSAFARYDWRPLTQHVSWQSCEDAAKKLGYTASNYRCVGL
jgi:hypothetical protein